MSSCRFIATFVGLTGLACCGQGSSGGAGPTDGGGTDATAGLDGANASDGAGTEGGPGGPDGAAHDASTPGDASTHDAGIPITPDAFYVATSGADTNLGTLASPFATLAQAQKAMRASTMVKTTYVRAGTYQPAPSGGNCDWGNAAGSTIGLDSSDDGETWSGYPPDGYGSAILDGQSTTGNSGGTGGNGTGCAFGASTVKNLTIVGLQMQHYLYAGFWGYAATNVTLRANEVHHTTAATFSTAALFVIASPGAVIANNYVHDLAYMGIAASDNSTNGDGMSNTTVSGNVVANACTWPADTSGTNNDQNGGDCGGIYFWSQKTTVSTNLRITSNVVRDLNTSSMGQGDFGSCCTVGVYLDDGTNNVVASGNVVSGITSACFMIHGGQDNTLDGNLCDLGPLGTNAIVSYQPDGFTQMTGNVFEHNVVVAGSTGAGGGYLGIISPPNPMTIQHNAYFNYVGASVATTSGGGAGNDASPVTENPDVSCWAPGLPATSPVLAAPVSFPGLAGGWGPPGFTMPMTGTPPSWPHGC